MQATTAGQMTRHSGKTGPCNQQNRHACKQEKFPVSGPTDREVGKEQTGEFRRQDRTGSYTEGRELQLGGGGGKERGHKGKQVDTYAGTT
jgi:hypothetical protein